MSIIKEENNKKNKITIKDIQKSVNLVMETL